VTRNQIAGERLVHALVSMRYNRSPPRERLLSFGHHCAPALTFAALSDGKPPAEG
jgi:hypothetical protein